ncbi:MAG: hypothetical protein R3300_08815 [Candidatus Promineifilaceae bacterium]|nr:hypothetical protein [Candidatus Promineifilaceae bacterium]
MSTLLPLREYGVQLEQMSYRVIQASEIAEYAYCRRAWWLKRRRGHSSANSEPLARGRRHHQAHGRVVVAFGLLQRLALVVLFVAVAILVFALAGG